MACSVAKVFKGSIVATVLSHHSLSNGLWEAGMAAAGPAVLHVRAVRSGGTTVKMLKCSLTDFYMLHQFSSSPNPLEGQFTLKLDLCSV